MKNMNKIPITIADITIDLYSPLTTAELGISDKLGQFLNSIESPLARLTLVWEESRNIQPRGELIFDPGSIWKMYKDNTFYYALFKHGSDIYPYKKNGLLRVNPEWSEITLFEKRTGNEWQSCLNTWVSELVIKTAILFTGGLTFHSAGLDDNGKAVLYVGHSGAGKSTQLNLWNNEPGVTAMNEDRMAVQIPAGVPVCYGTPWGGIEDIGRNHSAPLSAIVIPEQSQINDISIIKPSEAAHILAARAFLPYWDASLMIKAMSNLNNILERVPVYRLRCRPEKEAISLVRSVL